MTEFSEAYNQGLAAAEQSVLTNPYAIGSLPSRAWLQGRMDAQRIRAYEEGQVMRELGVYSADDCPPQFGKEWLTGFKGTRKPDTFRRQLQRNAEAAVLT